MLFQKGDSGPKIKEIQERLAELGLFDGTAQGNYGTLTKNAVTAFQEQYGLEVDGIVGDETWGALFVPIEGTPQGGNPPPPRTADDEVPPWLIEGLTDLGRGTEEIAGPDDNPDIVAYHQFTSLKAKDDETAWCASAACAWLERAGVESPRSAAAASFKEWGQELEAGQLGCLVVMSRTGGNHVFLYLDEDENGVYGIGGNQGDRVSVTKFAWANITNFRWPV
jgi:uncharacterized protein (TIGR02594 family)